MSITLTNSWSAHDKLPGKCSLVLPPTTPTSTSTCRKNLVSVPDCFTILISPSGHVQLLYHAHWDKPSPICTDGSNKNLCWTLLGVGDSPHVATFNLGALATIVKAKAPSWKAMHYAPNAESIKTATVLGLTCNAVVSILPSPVYHFFLLSITLACSMNTVDRYLAQLGQALGSVATAPVSPSHGC
jgi:hypothetical protein